MDSDAVAAAKYDPVSAPLERRFLGPHRPWICERAAGEILEVAAGTGANFAHYEEAASLTVVEISPGMLEQARMKAHRQGRDVRFIEGDAQDLPFADATFDAVVSTFALCGIADNRLAIAEMVRVLRPGGRSCSQTTSWPPSHRCAGRSARSNPSRPAPSASTSRGDNYPSSSRWGYAWWSPRGSRQG